MREVQENQPQGNKYHREQ